MPKKRDLNTIAKLEQAIAKKYGEKAVQHPRSNWDEDKEEEYLEQLKKLLEKEDKTKTWNYNEHSFDDSATPL